MIEFFNALGDPSIPFLRYALIAGLLSSISFGIIGTYVVVKRISYIAGGIAHSVLAGIGASIYFKAKYDLAWLSPTLGALIAAVIAALIIGLVSMAGRQREDTVIGSIWAIGMAIGVLFISKTSSYVDPMSYLFGNILIVSYRELILIAILDAIIITLSILFHNQLLAVSFVEEFALVRGMRAHFYYMALLILTALSIVLLTQIVGIILVIALLTIPAAVSSMFSRNMWQTMLFASIITAVFTSFGTAISYAADTPSGSTIIVFAGGVYLLVMIIRGIVQRIVKNRESEREERKVTA
jgi:zinc transport system permease protein